MPEDLFSFENLYKAHLAARRGKRHKKDVIAFEMDLAHSIWNLKNRIDSGRYKIHNYNTFNVYEPKKREIQAVKYSHRVVMHCLCDNYLTPLLEKRLIYDNAACRKGKGTHFSLRRLKKFFCEHYKQYGNEGYILKMDICKYFPSINHEILIGKLRKIIEDEGILEMMEMIISSWNGEEGKGLPMGNQTSQWFALYYLDEVDRLIKEKLAIKYYVRYMDDMVIIHHDRGYLKEILRQVRLLCRNLKLELNAKTQISPIKNG
ncbi:MAG: RNA-directed DNA polymerase, partial [Oscillospiraceae bacterium]|nr:RNA-directed DNA polymerase [Oscillospiraceae bacterium]